jgi:hypothetical protein
MSRPSTTRDPGRKSTHRKLRVFAFDPGVGAQLETISISEFTLEIAWEDNLKPGPVGDYVEVVDFDPASDCFYAPVDLDNRYILAEGGLAPSEGGPQFHQQMVYAVAMNTIDHFERALGRVALWAHRVIRDPEGRKKRHQYVGRLRIYPHALREANAYYSPRKKALLFGYFPTRGEALGQIPGGMVFTSLSYDIVAHETTHALLDGLHPSFNEATNPDVYALHEGFADIVALFQRFAQSEVLEHQIARTRGDLASQNMLGELAQQFGHALGMRKALRSALGEYKDGRWSPHRPDPGRLKRIHEPHERGAILLAAVFSAFLSIYKLRSADLFRIASNGTGILADGAIHPDLVRRLAVEAAEAARAVLTMCIRGLDYCPPVDIDFGTYLRAVVTADAEVYPEEKYHYRTAFIEAFRQWGIYPNGVRSMAVCDLRYRTLAEELGEQRTVDEQTTKIERLRELTKDIFRSGPPPGDTGPAPALRDPGPSDPADLDLARSDPASLNLDWDLTADRKVVWEAMQENAKVLHKWLMRPQMSEFLPFFGLTRDREAPPSVFKSDGLPTIEVHSVRTARRRGARDSLVTDLVVEVRQRRRGYLDVDEQNAVDTAHEPGTGGDFRFRRGCTLIIDPLRKEIRYAIRTKGTVSDNVELRRVRNFLSGEDIGMENPFYKVRNATKADGEPFAALHRHQRAILDF